MSLGPVIGHLKASTLQDQGVLAQCHVNIVQLQDHVEYSNYQSELKYLLEEKGRLDTVAELIQKVNELSKELKEQKEEIAALKKHYIPELKEILSLKSLWSFITGLWKIWLGKEEK